MTKERPIIFSAPMVRAILNGSKTQTRCVAKEFAGRDELNAILHRFPNQNGGPFEVGMRLWVREAFRFTDVFDQDSPSRVGERCVDAGYRMPWAPLQFEADGRRMNWTHTGTPPHDGPPVPGKLRPGIHMPRWASRITLEVTGVRVKRLQDISEAAAIAEGVERVVVGEGWRRYHDDEVVGVPPCATARDSYPALWEQINGDGSWDANPWVWVIEFRRAA